MVICIHDLFIAFESGRQKARGIAKLPEYIVKNFAYSVLPRVLFLSLSCLCSDVIWNWDHLFIVIIICIHARIIRIKCENPSREFLKLTVQINSFLLPNILVFVLF